MARTTYPKSLGALLNRLGTINLQKKKAQAELKKITQSETDLKEHLIKTFTKDQLQSAKGKTCMVSVTKTDVPSIVDWDAFWQYAKRKSNNDLIHRRVATAAWRERLLDHKEVPGVELFTRVGLSVRQLK